jgi:hypothetical protein
MAVVCETIDLLVCRKIHGCGCVGPSLTWKKYTDESIPPDVWRYIVGIGDTVLIIIPPEALASKYRSDFYADSDSTSTSSGDSSLHL